MKLAKLTNWEDWEGFYVNGELVFEGHKVEVSDILPFLSKGFSEYSIYEDTAEILGSIGNCPKLLSEALSQEGITLHSTKIFDL